MPVLFEETTINGMRLKNRFVRSATWAGMAGEDGVCTSSLVDLMVGLAEGGVGLIVSGHAYVDPVGQASPRQLGVHTDEMVPGLTRMVSAVHERGGRIVLQSAHAGCRAPRKFTGGAAMGPSASGDGSFREMTVGDIRSVVGAFVRGAVRARAAGFDGVQLHAAHGYLLSQFLSPYYNHRKDDYGGRIENRARILLEVAGATRREVGGDFPILVKLNSEDFIENGMTRDEMIRVAEMLEGAGVDAIELSGGTGESGDLGPVRKGAGEIYYREAARVYKEKIGIPLLLVGGIRSYDEAEGLVSGNFADYISLCRPLIREPNLIDQWRSGDTGRATCISCNLCFRPAFTGKGIYCVTAEKEGND